MKTLTIFSSNGVGNPISIEHRDIIECEYCGKFTDKNKAIVEENTYFCSLKCIEEYTKEIC